MMSPEIEENMSCFERVQEVWKGLQFLSTEKVQERQVRKETEKHRLHGTTIR